MFSKKVQVERYRECPHCRHVHDKNLDVCPKCGQVSDGPSFSNRFVNVVQLHWVKQLFFFLIGWAGLAIVGTLIYLFFGLYARATFADPNTISNYIKSDQVNMMVNILTYGLLLTGLLALLWKDIFVLLKSFTKLRVLTSGLSYGAIIMGAVITYNLIIIATGYKISDNQNETSLTNVMRIYPILSFLAFVIFGPIVEEITYRLGLFSLLHRFNRPLAYIVTILVFGLIHMSFNADTIVNELVNLPSYLIAGAILIIAYEKEGFGVSTIAHVANNMVSFILTITGR